MSSFTKVYWRSTGVPAWGLIFLIIIAIAALLAAEKLQKRNPIVEQNYSTMITAATTMRQAMDVIKPIRAGMEPINPVTDPQRSGLVGISNSIVTSNHGGKTSKQTTVNPNWAAVAVKLMAEAGVQKGDRVAVTVSGSFPAINLAVYSAIEAIGAKPVIIASATSSQWGANVPGLLWIDMSRKLREKGILHHKETAVSLGAIEDRGVGIDDQGIESVKRSINRVGTEFLYPRNYQEAVAKRIAIFREAAEGEKYKAFINVGGGATIVGPPGIDDQFHNGLIYDASSRAFAVDTVMGYFLQEGIPGIHFINIKNLADEYGLPIAPAEPVAVGNGGIYSASSYRRWLAAVLGLALFGMTWLIVRSARITSVWRRSHDHNKSVRPMV
ncbi:poly-gamma-glutamate system protein [Idiomarina tyrosinivorans]|uniref:Poly-gamma-glutamate system protein n=1 Tax=Idiomarina tyrosinivorans TaxID=1445662 RepID=A0A432ZQ83_9GAMM|nr:poly-gamma-glutamate system protein [Idiomarina tyrosinivorans]RUO79986.1 poly-gamma-glutamate system protein [Idiomarina tyrosinivorans]